VVRLTGTKHSILWECDRYISALREIKAGIPPSVEQCVARCRRKDSAQRFQTMSGAKLQQSIVSFETTLRLSPFSPWRPASWFLAAAPVRRGNLSAAKKLMEGVMQRRSKQYVSPACLGIYHAALGQADSRLEFLKAALSERDPYLTRMDAEPYFDPFRSDPRIATY